jgi:hypothetical protein
MKRATLACVVALCAVASTTVAQESPYAAIQDRSIKALSADAVEAYLDGRGMGFALAAELNGYPGPLHVLELADSLALDPERRDDIQAAFDRMHADAVRLGKEIVHEEAALDSAFVQARISQHELRERLTRIATLKGKLRYVHLAAHLDVTALLSEHERHEYQRLRGYADGHDGQHRGHGRQQ